MKIKEKVLNDFAHKNQYPNWKQVIKDKQSMTFEAKEFEEEIDLTLAEVSKVIDDLGKSKRSYVQKKLIDGEKLKQKLGIK